MSLAQEETDRLLFRKERFTYHPEDRHNSDNESRPSHSDDENNDDDDEEPETKARYRKNNYYLHSDDNESDLDDADNMLFSKSTSYHVPSTVFDANTGPKGVIADAQSYERAKKRSFRRTLRDASAFDYKSITISNKSEHPGAQRGRTPSTGAGSKPQSGAESGEDEQFMLQWRENRMRELQQRNEQKRSGPNKKRYGNLDAVNATGYLDAIEKAPLGVAVVVCIYDPESSESSIVEDALTTLARKHSDTRFVKLHHEVAEMDHVTAPALLAYKNGEVFATILDVLDQIPNGRSCSAASLGDLLMQYRIV